MKRIKLSKSKQKSPQSEHIAGDLCRSVVKTITAHGSPGTVVVDLEASAARQTVVANKSY